METFVSNELDHIAYVWKEQKNVITTTSEAIKVIVRIDKRLAIAWDFKMVAIRM